MTRLMLLTVLGAIAWHYAAPQREFAADVWRDVEYRVSSSLPDNMR